MTTAELISKLQEEGKNVSLSLTLEFHVWNPGDKKPSARVAMFGTRLSDIRDVEVPEDSTLVKEILKPYASTKVEATEGGNWWTSKEVKQEKKSWF